MADLYIGLYICLTIYHVADCFCVWYFFDIFDPHVILTVTCVCSVIFKFCFFYRVSKVLCRLQPLDIGQINVEEVLLPELNFNFLEVALNLVQSALITSYVTARSCVDVRSYCFSYCGCAGAVGQVILFLKNLCGSGGRRSSWYCQDNKALNFIGVLIPCVTLVCGYYSIAIAQGLPSC